MLTRYSTLYRPFTKNVVLSFITVILMASCLTVSAYIPYSSFNYMTKSGKLYPTLCPAPFVPVASWDASTMRTSLDSPNDLFITASGEIFVTDTQGNAILVLSSDGQLKRQISSFTLNGKVETFNKPEGTFVTEQGDIYVADTENNRVVLLDQQGQGKQVFTVAANDLLGKNYIFYPRKLAVDAGGLLYVVARGQYNGIMRFTQDGEFSSFVGSNRVQVTWLDKLWRRLMTKEQREKSVQNIPLEYSNLSLNEDNFLYAVTQATSEAQKVKRFNPGGTDVLARSAYDSEMTKDLRIADICTDGYGNYYYIDQSVGRIYVINADGSLLYAFAGTGEQRGVFRNPSSIDFYNDCLYVTDGVLGTVTVFEMTDYTRDIRMAEQLYLEGQYEESRVQWEKVLRQNTNMETAYIYLGKIAYRQENYRLAMTYFRKCNYRGSIYAPGYGTALELYRTELLQNHLAEILTGLSILSAAVVALFLWRKKKVKRRREERS